MKFTPYYHLENKHSVLSASQSAWVNYDSEKMANYYRNQLAKQRGTELHEFASQCIKLNQQLMEDGTSLPQFVNDAIGYGMDSEVVLYYSDNAFATADAISYSEVLKQLRIHDLKTGTSPVNMRQLKVYAAYFFLSYGVSPKKTEVILRIYQFGEVVEVIPSYEEIAEIMKKIKEHDEIITKMKRGEL